MSAVRDTSGGEELGRDIINEDNNQFLAAIMETSYRSGDIVSTEERRLTLAYEGLIHPPTNLLSDYGPIIEILDLSHNSISNLDFLSHFSSLTTLILDHNCVSENSVFPPLPLLSTLWLNNNLISNLHPFIPLLGRGCGRLRTLSLMGNEGAPSYLNGGTYYQYLQYRLFVISWMEELQYLDDRQVTNDQRQEATRLYGRKLIRSLKQSLQLYTPSEVMRRFRTLFANKFPRFGDNTTNRTSNNEDEAIETFFGEGIQVQEMGVSGLFLSDSSSASSSTSLNHLGGSENSSFEPDPSIRGVKYRGTVGKNLVI